jgi:hypothetical protein
LEQIAGEIVRRVRVGRSVEDRHAQPYRVESRDTR